MPIKITGDQSSALAGTATAGATLEAINLTYAAGNKKALDEFEAVGKVGSNGKFSLALGDLQDVKEGDYVRLRAKNADGTSGGVITVRIEQGKTDKRAAPFVVPRLAVYDAQSGGKAIVTADDKKRPVSEPYAVVTIENTRTGDVTDVTLDKDGLFPTHFAVKAKPGDLLTFGVSDGTNALQKVASYAVVGKIAHPNDIADPDAHHDQKDKDGRLKVGMELFTGPLFTNGVGPTDPGQQAIADCYLPAAIASLAKLRPDVISKMITDNGDGSYTVVFKEWNAQKQKYVSAAIEIDADLYVDGQGKPIYGAGLPIPSAAGKKMELWFPLIEKAYAQWLGSYEAIGNGGSAADVMSAALGLDPVEKSVKSATVVWKDVMNAVDNKIPAAFGTADSAKKYVGTGIYEDHAYSVLDYRTKNGVRQVQLRNPWGSDEPGDDGKDDGVFWFAVEDCVKLFTDFYTVE